MDYSRYEQLEISFSDSSRIKRSVDEDLEKIHSDIETFNYSLSPPISESDRIRSSLRIIMKESPHFQ